MFKFSLFRTHSLVKNFIPYLDKFQTIGTCLKCYNYKWTLQTFVGTISILSQAKCAFGFWFTCWQKTWEGFTTAVKLAVASVLCLGAASIGEKPAPLRIKLKTTFSPSGTRCQPGWFVELWLLHICFLIKKCTRCAQKLNKTAFSHTLTHVCNQLVLTYVEFIHSPSPPKKSFEDWFCSSL